MLEVGVLGSGGVGALNIVMLLHVAFLGMLSRTQGQHVFLKVTPNCMSGYQVIHVFMVGCWYDMPNGWQVQHQMAPTFVGDSIHETEGDKGSEAMTGGSLLAGPGMTEMPGLQAALAAASAAMQAAGQSMPPPAPLTLQPDRALSQACPLWYHVSHRH